MKAISPAYLAEKIKIPILLISGERDEVVPYEQSERMAEELEDLNKDVEYIELEDSGHNIFYYLKDSQTVYNKIEKFLGKHLSN